MRSPLVASLSLLGALASLIYAGSEFKKRPHAPPRPTSELLSKSDQHLRALTPNAGNPAPQSSPTVTPSTVPVASTPRPHNFGTGGVVSGRFDVLACFTRDEALVASYLASLRGQLGLRYREFFISKNLSPAQESQLLDLLVLYGTRRIEIDVAAYATGLTTHSSTQVHLKEVQQDYESAVQALLGPEAIHEIKAFERNEPHRQRVHQLASILSASHSPLTPSQGALLLNTFKRMNTSSTPPKEKRPDQPLEMDEAISESASYLSEFQVDALKAVLAPQRAARLRTKAR